MTAPPPPSIEVDPQASALLDLLVELGHLDEARLGLVNDALLDLQPADGQIDLQQLRRVAAQVLFDAEASMDPDGRRALASEWTILFG